MSVISDFIVYLWLLPVVAQILIPLALFLAYTVTKAVKGITRQEVDEKMTSFSTPAVK